MDARQERFGRNEVLFRELNERIESVNEFLDAEAREGSFVCECGRADCTERIRMDRADYERVRAEPSQFLVVTGHVEPDIEFVVESREGWSIIRKREGGPAELSVSTNPRA